MKIIWKVYFWIFTFVVASGYTTIFSGKPPFFYYVDLLFSILGLVGIWCFAYEKGLFRPSLWRMFFCLFLLWNIINIIYGPFYSGKEVVGQKEQMYGTVISVIISLPAYIALFFYGFRSNEIWNKS